MAEKSISVGRLRWRCRRGTKELDRILGGFLEEDYAKAPAEVQKAFIAFLDVQDPDIYDWLMGGKVPDDEGFKMIVALLQEKY